MAHSRKRPNLKIERKAAAPKEKEIRIPIKKKTAENILTLNGIVNQKWAEYQQAVQMRELGMQPILTEAGIDAKGGKIQVKECTEKPPYELVVGITK